MLNVNWPGQRTPRPGLELEIEIGGGSQPHSNGQGRASQHQPAHRGSIENGQDQNSQENAISQKWPQTQSHQQCEGGSPICYKCRGWGHISHNCHSTQNYTEQG